MILSCLHPRCETERAEQQTQQQQKGTALNLSYILLLWGIALAERRLIRQGKGLDCHPTNREELKRLAHEATMTQQQQDRNSVDSSFMSTTTTTEQSRQAVVQRPTTYITEGQLRWAQFHHRRRAQQVKSNVELLYQMPATIHQVEGAFSEDGNSSVASFSPPRPKPKISRGRRALLRVSQRRFRARAEMIRERGFRRTADAAAASSSSEEDEGDALACIFAETAAFKRRRRKKRHSDDRGRRFDEAFHALMMNVAASQQPQFAAVQTPTKIWTRPAETPMIDVNYDAMKQMGIPTNSRKSMQATALPMDRGASWLVHLPKTEKASNESRRIVAAANAAFAQAEHFPNEKQGPPSPVKQRFRDIVHDFQMKADPPPAVPEPMHYRQPPTMRLQKYFAQLEDVDEKKEDGSPLPATRLDFQRVQERIQSFEKRPLPTDEDELADLLTSMDPDFLEEMEALNPGVKERLRALYLRESSPTVKQLARIIETPITEPEKPRGLVRGFVARIEKAAKKENLISADGKLHKPTFAKLINQYLMEAKGSTISPRRRQPVLDSLVSKFQESEETDSIIDDEGRLDRPVLEHLVTRYLAELTGQDEHEILEAEDWDSLQTEEYRERPPFIQAAARHMRQQVMARAPRGEEEWCEVVEMSMIASLPQDESATPPSWAVRRLAERCAALVPGAWDQINTIEEVIEDELEEAQRIHLKSVPTPQTPVAVSIVSTPPAKSALPTPEVKRFIVHLEHAAEVEPLVQNGTFHLPTFTKLVNRYWIESTEDSADFINARTPVLLARAKRSSVMGKAAANEKSKSPGTVKRFLANMESAVNGATLVDDSGRLNHTALVQLVAEELKKASDPPEKGEDVLAPNRESIGTSTGNHGDASLFSGEESDFFSVIRRNREKVHVAKSVVSELTLDSPRRRISYEPSHSVEPAGLARTAQEEGIGRKAARNITGAVTNKVGGLFGRLFQRDNSSEQHSDDMQAVAAYRKQQDERRLSDDTSSLSSFRALPEGIKNVVKNFRRSSAATSEPARISATESVDDNMSSESETLASISRSHVSGSHSEFSPERVKSFHKKVMEKSALIGGGEISNLIIDTDGSEASFDGVNPDVLASLLLSPTILTKRHHQAIRAIEKRNWDQVSYLISANPWLCEMPDVTTNQYLLHKLALYGGGESTVDRSTGEVLAVRYAPAPTELDIEIVRLFPSSVHKFDQDGNLPLHMAAAAANVSMVEILGDRFPSGATVRNEDGLLPIHLVILACGSPRAVTYGDAEGSTQLIRTMLNYFPASVAIPDNEGNLPIHTAASVLRGDVGVDVIHLLLDEASRQLSDPGGARFKNKISMEEIESSSQTVSTEPTDAPTDSEEFDEVTLCTMVCNDAGETPLMGAIHARCGWEVIDALVQGSGGQASALMTDMNRNNALHLLVGADFLDPAAALSILKNAPETARHRNEEGMLPIEIACMQLLAKEMILAIVLVDLPIELDSKEGVKVREKQGSSWWYLVCESDDHFVDVVDEVISMCTYAQIRELCFMEGHSGQTLIARATPKCRAVLQKGLRFLGRFEFVGQSALLADPSRGIKIFEAIDYGPNESPYDLAKRVILKCFSDETTFQEESRISREFQLDHALFEEMDVFSVTESGGDTDSGPKQFCMAIERPQLTLGEVVSGMLANEDCQTDEEVRRRYATKVFSVLRIVGKALSSLHSCGLVHGNISLTHIGKYETKWKVAEVLSIQREGDVFDPDRFSPSSPPESVVPRQQAGTTHEVTFRMDLETNPAIDIWAFGKLAFEALAGEPLILFDENREFDDDHRALMDILHWNEFNLDEVADKLRRSAVVEEGVSLVLSCLDPNPSSRPSIDDILDHPVWKDLRRQR